MAAVPIENGTFDYDTYATATLTVPEGAEAAYRAAEGWKLFFYSTKTNGIIYTVDMETQTASVTGHTGEPVDVAIPATVNIGGTDYPVTAIGNLAFTDCFTLQSVNIPQGITSIGSSAFYSCDALQSVTLPERLQTIGGHAFAYCPLRSITSLAAIENGTFDYDTYATATLTVPEGAEAAYRAAEGWRLFFYSTKTDGIIYTVDAETQTAIVTDADANITTANVLATVEYEGTEYPVTAIGGSAFSVCSALQSVILPEGLQTIGGSAFYVCSALQSVTFPQGLQTIGDYAFERCLALQSVTLPEGLQTIGTSAFYWCESLQNIILPSTLQKINARAFYGCPLTDVHAYATRPPVIDESTFSEDTYATATLHVPSDVTSDYQAAEYWKEFLLIVGDLPSTAISSVAADASLATYAGGILTTESPAAITVYAQNGAQALHTSAATSLSLAGLPSGIYIICIDMEGQRQVMKVAR